MVEVVFSIEAAYALEVEERDVRLQQAVAQVVALLRDFPMIGRVYARSRHGVAIRRRLVDRRWHIYYRYNEQLRRVTIVAIHGARRGDGPLL